MDFNKIFAVWLKFIIWILSDMGHIFPAWAVCSPLPNGPGECNTQAANIIWTMSCKKVSSGIYKQQIPRSTFTSIQFDQGLHILLTELLGTTECINGEYRPWRHIALCSRMGNFRINPDIRIKNFYFKHEISLSHLFPRPSFCVKSKYLG